MAGKAVATQGDTGGGVAVLDLADYPALTEGIGELARIMDENAGRTLRLGDLERLKVPTGGGVSFEVTDALTGETDNVRKVLGILVHWRRVRSYWEAPKKGEPEISHDPPVCSSGDGKFPIPGGAFADGGYNEAFNLPVLVNGEARRTCRGCPMNEWGSHPKEGREGKACKERILLFLQQAGEMLPTILSVPPTSIKIIEQFMIRLSMKYGAHYSGFQLEFGLTKIEKSGTEPYSQVTVRLVGILDGTARNHPVSGSPAEVALDFAAEFAALLSEEELVAASNSGGKAAGDTVEGEVLPDGLGGDFADHDLDQEATVGS